MKTFVCLTALSLLACGNADFASPNKPITTNQVGEAGADNDPGVGGSAPIGNPQAGKAGAPMGGTDTGSSGAPDDLPASGSSMGGNAGMATAGQGSAAGTANGAGMAGMPSAGNGSGGMGSAGSGMGGTDSPAAGTGGINSAGTGGTDVTPIDECSEEGRVGNWTAPVWNWNDSVKTTACVSQMNRVGKSVLTLKAPANCAWEDPDTGHWEGCAFVSTLVCQPIPGGQGFSMQVRDTTRAVSEAGSSTNGSLTGTIYYKPATAGGCSELANTGAGSMSVSADRY